MCIFLGERKTGAVGSDLRADLIISAALTYIRLVNLHLGYLLNFGEAQFKNGIKRLINGSFHRDLRGHRARLIRF
jgi:hypothetical protein